MGPKALEPGSCSHLILDSFLLPGSFTLDRVARHLHLLTGFDERAKSGVSTDMNSASASVKGEGGRLHDLPPQVLDLIVRKIDAPSDIARFALVCKALNEFVKRAPLRIKLCGRPGIVGHSELETAKYRRTLLSLASHFSGIVELDLSSTNLSNGDVEEAVAKLPRLLYLSLSNCTKVSETLPMMLYRSQPPYRCLVPDLESLDLSRCFQLTDAAIYRVFQWSLTPKYPLRAASFGKMSITSMTKLSEVNLFVQRLQELVPGALKCKPFEWSSLRILCLNNVERMSLITLDLIVICCPNLAVLGLGGSTILEDMTLHWDSPFIAALHIVADSLGVKPAGGCDALSAAWLYALVTCLPRLWLIELTFFPRAVVTELHQLISKQQLAVTDQQLDELRFIDFNLADSVLEFQTRIAEPFRRFQEAECSGGAAGITSLDLWRFEHFPSTFLNMMINTASYTSRGGSMIAPSSTYTFSQAPLHCAAESGDTAHVSALIKIGVMLELRGRGGGSPLFKAAREGFVGVVLLLLEAQVNPLTANRHDETSLYIAALRGHARVVDVIVSFCEYHGIDWKQSSYYKDGWTPLMAAAVADRCDVAKCLLYAATTSAAEFACMKNRYHQTALHIAAYRGCTEMVALLVEAGGQRLVSAIDSYGRSAIAIARSRHEDDALTLLLHGNSRRRRFAPRVDFRARWRQWMRLLIVASSSRRFRRMDRKTRQQRRQPIGRGKVRVTCLPQLLMSCLLCQAATGGAKRALSPGATRADPPSKKNAVAEPEGGPTPKVDEDFEAWLTHQSLTLETLLTKTVKLGKPSTTKQYQAKTAELQALIKDFRAAARFLLKEKTRLTEELDATKSAALQLKADSETEKTQRDALIAELETKVERLEEKLKEAQSYVESLQSYNASLQNEMIQIKETLCTAERERLKAVEDNVILKGKSDNLLETLKEKEERHRDCLGVLDEKMKALQMGKEQDGVMIAHLKAELQQRLQDLNLTQGEMQKWKEMAEMYKEKTGQSAEEMEKIECTRAALESQYSSQNEVLERLRREIAICQTQKQLSQQELCQKDAKITELHLEAQTRETQIEELEMKLRKAEDDRKKLHNTIQELKGNIRVFCRVRPLKETEQGDEPGTENRIIRFPLTGDESAMSILCPPGPQQPYQELHFAFDHIFQPAATQAVVFEEISQLVQSALDGYKVCIFAYGQTGSGKTYTMVGSKDAPGVIPLSMDQVFQSCRDLEERGWKFAMHASMLEIYNEEYHDLLGASTGTSKKRTVSHDTHGNTTVSDLTLVNVREPGKVEQLLEKALQKRSVGATLLNDQSSRSHFVFTLRIEGRNFETEQRVQGVLNLIDLAGSERVKESGATGARLKEAQNINKSLSALGDVIVALSNKAEHIPYRNSKLTWLLQPCLGKESKTLMFVNVSPCAEHCHESLCSLKFAAKVNTCEIGIAKRNILQSSSKN